MDSKTNKRKLYPSTRRLSKRKRCKLANISKKQKHTATTSNNTNSYNAEVDNEPKSKLNKSKEELPYLIEKNTANPVAEGTIEGRRIFDIKFLVEQLKKFGSHSSPYGCSAKNMVFIAETRKGCNTVLHFKCNMCGIKENILSELEEDKNMDINKAVVFGNLCTGHSFAQMEERFSIMNMPSMSTRTYFKIQADMHSSIQTIALKEMDEAIEEETALAIARGDTDKGGIPLLTVIIDGSWAKRSYKCNFNSLSGVACIIGFHTGKVLFLGVRNVFCIICAKAENSKTETPEHKCFKNWHGTANAMESDIILEGFLRSMKMHGVKYTRVIGDGDSSVTDKLRRVRPYGLDQEIQKIECTNHICRNFNNKLKDLTKKKEIPLAARNILNANLKRIRVGVHCAINKRSAEDVPNSDKEKLLTQDLLNTPYHVFGVHTNCANTSTRCEGHENDENNIETLKEFGLWDEVTKLVNNVLIKQVGSLVYNVNNNHCERYNSVVAKLVGGKRCNFIQRDSYNARCGAAAASYNNRPKFYTSINKAITKNSPGKYIKRYETKISRKREKCRKSLKFKPRTIKTGPDFDYGRLAVELDLDPEEYATKAKEFLKQLEDSNNMHLKTMNQSNNSLWHSERLKRLTASNFGRVCRMRPNTSRTKFVANLLYSKFSGSKATNWGHSNEKTALKEAASMLKITYDECGLFVHKQYNYLGASPDAVIRDSRGIIEIKCPFKGRHLSPLEATRQKFLTFCNLSEDKLRLKRNHQYFYQVQGQMEVTDTEYCIFVVWTPHGTSTEIITRDREFWEKHMKQKLEDFYINNLLSELVDPRYRRNLPIRE